MLFMSCASNAFASAHCCLVVTCWERADLLALVGDVYCIFVTFQCGILGQLWYLIVSFPDICHLPFTKLLTYCLIAIKKHEIKYWEKAYERSGNNLFWSIKILVKC